SPYSTTIDTTKFANGTYTLVARATDNAGAVTNAQISVTISNAAALPSTGTKAIPTFESVGLYWTPGTDPGAAGCTVQYRKQGDSAWKDGLAMWYDARNSECRGSIVNLASGAAYDVQFALPGQQPSRGLTFTTWSDTFPIAKTVSVTNSSQPLNITQGGTATGYVLYTGPATIDVANAADYNVQISAPYVIVRGLTLKGARVDGVRLVQGAHDVVIEGNDISGWGRFSGKLSSDGWQIGTNEDSGIKAYCYDSPGWLERTIIQRNKIHDPRYGSNSWSDGHPSGPNAIAFFECGGNHVFRYNDIYSTWGHYFMDAIGGGENFSLKGFPNSDTDIYGNKIQDAWDDAIEAEGADRNVRVWRNYMSNTGTGVASTSISVGPMYIFRNVWDNNRVLSMKSLDGDGRLYMFKSGSQSGYGDGRRYVFHNTMLQAPPPAGSSYPLGGGEGLASPGGGQNLTNTVSRNNILHIWKSWWNSVDDTGGGMTPNDLDYDLVNGNVTAAGSQEAHRIVGTPIYAPNNGWSSEAGGMYQLDPSSPGYDAGARIPNFNDNFTGAAPDLGAHEAGAPAMKFGVQ
ncbi:MAG: hypothetical protein EPO20_12080, partial [Betaproteobacteria bacterium]